MGRKTVVGCLLESPSEKFSMKSSVTRLPSKPNEVKVNTLSRALIVDESPFFPLGFYLEWKRWQVGADNFTRAMFDEVANGFNTPLPYRSGTPQDLIDLRYLDFMDNMHKMGMKVHFNMYGTGMEGPSASKTETIKQYVSLLKDHPALLGYYIADEPDGQGTDPSWIQDTYDIVKGLDPYHPVSVVLNCMSNPVLSLEDFIGAGDIIMSDPYPLGLRNPVGCDSCLGTVEDVATRAEKYVTDIAGRKPFWMVPQAFGGEQHWDRQPNAREIRVMTYLSVIGQATGIQYFALGAFLQEYNQGIHWEPKNHMWAEARRVVTEVDQISPSLFSLDSSPPFEVFTPRISSRALYESEPGVITLLFANLDNEPKILEYSLLLPDGFNPIGEAPFEPRMIDQSKSIDVIDALGTRCFRFYSDSYLAQLQDLRKDNLILNPSFEIQHHLGFPDSYLLTWANGGSARLDSRTKVSGYYSLRITHPGLLTLKEEEEGGKGRRSKEAPKMDQSEENLVSGFESYLGSRVFANQTYVASLFVKAKTAGLQAEISSCIGSNKIILETEWKEYLLQGRVLENVLCSFKFVLLNQGVAWVDHLSLRKKV